MNLARRLPIVRSIAVLEQPQLRPARSPSPGWSTYFTCAERPELVSRLRRSRSEAMSLAVW